MATLYVHIPGSGITSHEVPQNQTLSIGEASENAFPLKAPSISPRHAEIISENGQFKLRDLGSANKSWVNGIAIDQGVLKDGDQVRFGKIEGLFLESDPVGGKPGAEPALRGRLALSTPEGDTAIVQFEGSATVGWKSDNDLQIKDPSVSGHHAQFIQGDDRYILKDLGSTNKTYVNQEPITEVGVNDGDVIQFGAVRGTLSIQFGLQRTSGGAAASGVELKELAAQVETLKAQAETAAKERDGLDFHNKALAAQLKDVQEQLESVKSESAAKQKELASGGKNAAASLAAAEARTAELEQSIAAARQKTEKAERELHDAKAQVEALCGDQTGQQQKIASLMQARDTLRAEKEQLASQLAEAQAKIEIESKATAESARKEAAGRLAEQANAIGDLKAQIEDLNGKLQAAMAKRDETLSKLEAVARERERDQADATDEVAAAEARAAKAEKEAKTAQETIDATARQLRDANALIGTLSGDQTGDRQQIAALTQTRDSLQQEKDRLTSQLAEAKTEAETAAKDRDTLKKELAEAQVRIRTLGADCEGFRSFEKTLQERIEALTKERDIAKAAATDLQAQIGLLCEENDETKAAGTQLQIKLDTMSKERDAAKASLAELQAKLDAMTEHRDEAKASGLTFQAKIESLTKERDAAKAVGTELQAKLDGMAKDQTDAKAAAAEMQARFDALNQESQSSQATTGQLQAQLGALTKERDAAKLSSAELQAKTDALAREVETAKASVNDLRAQLDSVSRDRRAAQESEAALRTRLDEVVRDRDSLRAAMSASAEQLAQAQRQFQALSAPTPAAPVPAATPMPTLSMPAVSMPAVPPPAAPQVPAPQPSPATPAAFPAFPKLSLAKEEPLPAGDPQHSLIEIATPAPNPAQAASRPVPSFGGGTPDLKKILETAPEALNSMRRSLHSFIKNQAEISLLEEFQTGLHCMAEETRAAKVTPVANLSNALEMLVDDLKKIPGQINPSSLRTVSQAVDFLVTLMNEKNLALTKDPSEAHLFAVDDDNDARKTILAALETINLRVSSAVDAREALDAFNKQQYDLVLIDVGLPDINGFELCTRVRKLPNYKKTPVLFITGAVTVQNRVQSSLSGGNDFIAKPFNLLELGVKALIWIFKGQLGMV